jgi:hypothetical protein
MIPNPIESIQMVIKINSKPLVCFSLIRQNYGFILFVEEWNFNFR